ncbi:MAG: CotH kinase family protein [Rothia sp. (in: high G+C Gram-positive bacteria)]|nr:CotH kinase family protein [Rothia sp. (in: high G+C Gram-positive bacteria)]
MPENLSRRTIFKVLAGVGASTVVAGGLSACGSTNTSSTSSSSAAASESTSSNSNDIGANQTSIFDGQAHEVSMTVSDENLKTLLEAFQNDTEKTWVDADATIDGTKIEKVGIRLKGNSTVKTLSSATLEATDSASTSATASATASDSASASSDSTTDSSNNAATDNKQPAGGGGGGGGGNSASSIDADKPQTWPFLIAFDKNTENQVFQGYSRMSLRPGIPVLNEAVALGMTEKTGQKTQKYTYVKYTLNGYDQTTRLMVVVPDEYYAAELGDGILYKSDSESSFSYQGDDSATYEDQFKQVNGDDNESPIIELLKWFDNASDEEFAADLAKHIDVDSFAQYVATQNLLVNSDDMAGPGKNYYLWYDNKTKLFTVIAWDLDLSMSGNASAGPDDTISMGGGGGGMPAGGQGMTGQGAGGQGGGGGMSSGNALKEKYLSTDSFQDSYHRAYWDLYDQIYGNNAAADYLKNLATVVPVTKCLTQETLDSSVKTLTTWISERTSALKSQRSS